MGFLFGYEFVVDEFVLGLYAADLLLCSVLPRRSRFALRLTFGSLVYFAVCYLLLMTDMSDAFLSVSVFGLIFLLMLALFFFCFRQNVWNMLFIGTATYATQHLCFQLIDVLTDWLDRAVVWQGVIAVALCILIYVSVYTYVYKVFTGKVRADELLLDNKRIIIPAGLVLLVTLGLSIGMGYLGEDAVFARLLCRLYAIVCCVLILLLQLGNLSESGLRRDYDTIRRIRREEARQYDFSRKTIEALNVKYHDMRHQLAALKGAVAEEYVQKLENMISDYDSLFRTGNKALDVVLTEKSLLCEHSGIRFTCLADGRLLAGMQEEDVYSLFGNALDNAIEGVSHVGDPAKKVIGLIVRRAGKMCSIHVENYFAARLEYAGGLPLTTHGDKDVHGFGMKSMRMNAEKYGGAMRVHTEDDIFYLDILLPAPPAEAAPAADGAAQEKTE